MQIGFISHHPRSDYWAVIGQFVREQANELGFEVIVRPTDLIEQQVAAIETFITKKVNAIIIGPRERSGLSGAIAHARAAGIPVVAIDNVPDDSEIACAVLPNNHAGGALAARYVVERISSGEVAHLAGPDNLQSAVERAEGVRSVFRQAGAIELVFDAVSDTFLSASGERLMAEALASHPNIKAVCAANDLLAFGALSAISAAGRAGDIVVVGYDAGADALLAIKQRRLDASIQQPLRELGRMAVQVAARLLKGEAVPPVVYVDVELVSLDNLLDFAIDTLNILPSIVHAAVASAEQLEQERSNLRTLVDALPDTIVFIKDNEHRFVLANHGMLALLGLQDIEQVLAKSEFDLFPAALASEHQAQDQHILDAGEPLDNHVEQIADAEGRLRWFLTSKVPLRTIGGHIVGIAGMSRDITMLKEAEAEQAELREAIIHVQEAALRELSTPLIPISEAVMVMPLIGAVDSRRAQQIMESLLEGLVAQRAAVVIIDITGVPLVDTQVANALVQAAQAVKLLGAQVMLSGIRPEVAQTLVGLGVDMSSIITRSTLQSSIAYALQRP